MQRSPLALVALSLLLIWSSNAAAKPEKARLTQIETALRETANYASSVLITASGKARMDYDIISSTWFDYEPLWHTGQLIWGLVETADVLNDPKYMDTAKRAGNWWVSTEFKAPHPFAGLVDAQHGDKLGPLLNWTTISDGTPGLFALSRFSGDKRYADTATRSGQWLWENTRVPLSVVGGEGLFYNIFDPTRAVVLKDWNPHKQGKDYDPQIASRAGPPPINELARPNIEGFLFADMCQHTGNLVWCDRFMQQARFALARQSNNGLWMDFEPNDSATGNVHPRFNIWNAEALVKAYEISKEKKFLQAAAKTARFYRDSSTKDGTLYYKLNTKNKAKTDSITGSAVAFNGLLMMQLQRHGYSEFDNAIELAATWLLNNRFSATHPDPNLAGAVINTRYKTIKGKTRILNRDVGTSFGMRFLAAYYRLLQQP